MAIGPEQAVRHASSLGVIDNGGQKLLYLEISGDPMRSGQAEKVKATQSAQ